MERLNLTFISHPISIQNDDSIMSEIYELLGRIGHIYSFIIYGKYDNDLLEHYEVNYKICDNVKFNTISVEDVATSIVKFIKNPIDRYVIGYKQPPLDILVVVLEPLVASLARDQSMKWRQFEYDDLYQECYLCLCKLYNKGYYIHKRLLEKTFYNKVIEMTRKRYSEFNIVSTNDIVAEDDGICTIEMTLRDIDEEYKKIDEEANIIVKEVYDDVCEIIKDMIGERRGEQLIKSYRTKNTDNYSISTMKKLRDSFNKLGLTRQKFNQKHGG